MRKEFLTDFRRDFLLRKGRHLSKMLYELWGSPKILPGLCASVAMGVRLTITLILGRWIVGLAEEHQVMQMHEFLLRWLMNRKFVGFLRKKDYQFPMTLGFSQENITQRRIGSIFMI